MNHESDDTVQSWPVSGQSDLKILFHHLNHHEQDIAHLTQRVIQAHVSAKRSQCDSLLALASDLTRAICASGGALGTECLISTRGLAKGLLQALREAGHDIYSSTYLAMQGIMIGGVQAGIDLPSLVRIGSQTLLHMACSLGAHDEEVMKKLAAGALETETLRAQDLESIAQVFLEMFQNAPRMTYQ